MHHETDTRTHQYRVILLSMLFLSLALRVSLVMSGGQNYWPDERRYDVSRRAADALWNGDVLGTLRALN